MGLSLNLFLKLSGIVTVARASIGTQEWEFSQTREYWAENHQVTWGVFILMLALFEGQIRKSEHEAAQNYAGAVVIDTKFLECSVVTKWPVPWKE